MSLLDVEDLHTSFDTDEGRVDATNGVSLTVDAGETVGVVGESGSGKSVTALSLMQLVESPGHVRAGRVKFRGIDTVAWCADAFPKRTVDLAETDLDDAPDDAFVFVDAWDADGTPTEGFVDLTRAPDRALREIRGDAMSMIFQDPMESLNPVLRVGDQIAEPLRVHDPTPGEGVDWLESSLLGNFVPRRAGWTRYPDSWERAVDLMREVGIPEPEQRATEYPHQFSGGMQQRAMIAMALACEPDLLIADEPTTALDVTIQAQILQKLDELQDRLGMGMLLITHNLGVVREVCDRVAVMYAGEIVETGAVDEVFADPQHPYTKALFGAIPSGERGSTLKTIPGSVPDLVDMPDACFFAPRCPYAHDACYDGRPAMYDAPDDAHQSRCVLHDAADEYGPGALDRDGLPDESPAAAGGEADD